jgi:hypothetical protein
MTSLDRILEATQNTPYLGAESEGGVIDPETFETHHEIAGKQPTQAVKNWLLENLTAAKASQIEPFVTPDVPETITEVNPPPLRSPRSTAASQRLFTILVDSVHQILERETGQRIQLIHGASLRPPNITAEDASKHVDPFKHLYYKYQIENHGDKVGAATGDHYNLSAPWKKFESNEEETDFYVRLAGTMRLMAAAITMGIATSSPLYYANQNGGVGTILTSTNSNRLSRIWPGRTIMDIPGLFSNRSKFTAELEEFLTNRLLLTGRDIWLPTRPQATPIHGGKSFQEVCIESDIDLTNPQDRDRALKMLVESFTQKSKKGDKQNRIKDWRVQMVRDFIHAPRNRVEMRVAETPPAFDNQTPYETTKAIHAFLELVFIFLSQNPEKLQHLTYSPTELQAAKHNEYTILNQGLDAKIYSPHNFRETTGRELLANIMEEPGFKELVALLERDEDLEPIQRIALSYRSPRNPLALPPAERIRQEIAKEYGIDARQSGIDRFLHDNNGGDPDRYPKELLSRTRAAMGKELRQIESDIPTVPTADQAFLQTLLEQTQKVRTMIPSH